RFATADFVEFGAVDDIGSEATLGQRHSISRGAFGLRAGGAGDHRDPTVTAVQQKTGRSRRRRSIVDEEIIDRQIAHFLRPGFDAHDADAQFEQRPEFLGAQREKYSDNSIHSTFETPAENALLALRVALGIDRDDIVPGRVCYALYALQQRREERIANIRHDDAQGLGAARPQRLCPAVRRVSEFARDLEHARRGRRLGRRGRSAEGERNCRLRDARVAGDIPLCGSFRTRGHILYVLED
ncbi:MAG TPA: hypothetical protein VFE63_13600, partial [Roseiarcus sp.]|nr:hypothetical protein [Roseiarcus sp.]